MSKDKILNDFRDLFISFLQNMYILAPNTILTHNSSIIESFIKQKINIVMDIYIKKVLIYKNEFNKNPELFISTHDFQQDLQEFKEVNLDQIFIFKNIWNKLNNDNKKIIIQFISYFNQLSEKYLNLM